MARVLALLARSNDTDRFKKRARRVTSSRMLPPRIAHTALWIAFLGAIGYAWWAGRKPGVETANRFGFTLTEVSHERGIDFVHRPAVFDAQIAHIMTQVAGVGAAVSLCDANGDGWLDFYATQSAEGARNALFVNQKDGTFRDLAGGTGLDDANHPSEGSSMGSIWADVDGDGDQDVFLYKYGYPRLLRNDGGMHFTDVTEAAGLHHWGNSNAATWIDYDRDGKLDLYVANYFREDVDLWHLKTTKIMQSSFEFATNGGHNHLFHNLGGMHFEEVTDTMGCDSTRWTLAVVGADLNGDGWTDLYLANDYGLEELFLNREGKRFELAKGIGLDESSKSGMSVALGDFQSDGHLGVYVTNITAQGYLMEGNNLRVNRLAERGWFQNVAEGQVADCGWSWGSQFGDLNNDGRADLYVVNGFVSGNKERDYWYDMTKLAIGAGELVEDARNWPPMDGRSLSGYERSRVLVNQGKMHFVDAAEAVGARDVLDGRAVALGDLWNRGVLDVVIANQSDRLLVYANKVEPQRHWIQLELVGTKGNTSAIGANATVSFAGGKIVQTVMAGSGFCAQNDLRLHYGLGDADRVLEAEIHWPSGAIQKVTNLRIDATNRIVEP